MRYQMAGIIHILAISGLHISLLGMGLYNMLKKAGFGIWPAGLLALIIMLQYGMMTGGGVSTMRAVCMFLLSVGAKIAGRIYDMPTGIGSGGNSDSGGEPCLSAGWGILAVLWGQ